MLQMPRMRFRRGVPHPGKRRPRKIKRVVFKIQDRFHHVGVHDVPRCSNQYRHRRNRRRRLLQQGIHRRIDRCWIEQRLISLDVDEHLAIRVRRNFGNSLRAGTVLGTSDPRFTAKTLHRFDDPFIIGRNNYPPGRLRLFCPLKHPLNHWFPRQGNQRLARQSGRPVPRRYYDYNL